MLSTHTNSIRASLTWLVVVCLLPVVLMMVWLVWDASLQKEAELKNELLLDARNLSAVVDREFVSSEHALFALASSPALRDADLAGFYKQSQVVANATGLVAITLLDAQLKPLFHTSLPFGQVQGTPVYRTHTEEVLKTGKAVTSVMFMGPVVKQYVTQIAVPVSDGRGVTHVLVGVVPADNFQKILEKYNLMSAQIGAIFDRSDAVVALVGATQTVNEVRGRKVNPGTVKALAKADEGTLVTINLQGQEILNAYSRSPNFRWGASLAMPRKILVAEMWSSMWRLMFVMFLILGFSLAAAWLMGGRIAAAVRALQEPARDLGAGRRAVLPALRFSVRETQEVGQAMVKASVTLAESNAALVSANMALERSNRDLQQFAFVASHDLKTPLRSIGGFVQILAKNHANVFDDNANALVNRTLSAVRRLEQLTEDLLSYAQIENASREFLPVDMNDVMAEVTSLLDASITQANGVVTAEALPTVVGDRTQLVQLCLNLVGNGLKYCTGRSPQVHVSAKLQEGNWVFSVTDNGIGIDERHHEKVFEIFKRLHTQNEFAGTGIGLALCRRIVEAHGGKIFVTSQPGVGSTFSFTLCVNFSGTL